MQLYIHRDGQQHGPYSLEEARNHIASGGLLAGDLAWHEGVTDWVPLAQVMTDLPAAAPAQAAWIPARRGAVSPSLASTAAPVNDVAGNAVGQSGKTSLRTASVRSGRSGRTRSSGVKDFRRGQRQIGARNMGLGALFFLGGLGVTAVTYSMATTGSGGGTYIVSWGAILFGGIRFVKGIIQFCQA